MFARGLNCLLSESFTHVNVNVNEYQRAKVMNESDARNDARITPIINILQRVMLLIVNTCAQLVIYIST
jgi:hypothetical protein